jgi:type VI secretion system ImpA family protein
MPKTDLHDENIAGRESIPRTIDDAVLKPISSQRSAGEDIRKEKLWVELRAARPKAADPEADGWEHSLSTRADWVRYRDLLVNALLTRTKDLEIALFLLEANARVESFAGIRDGLWVLGNLISLFARDGLHPQPADGDFELQFGKLDWLNDKFPDVICELPLTFRPDDQKNYSLNYHRESRRLNGMISGNEFDDAVAAGTTDAYKELQSALQQACVELKNLKQIAEDCYGGDVVSFVTTQETLEECLAVVENVLRKRVPQGNGKISPKNNGPDHSIPDLSQFPSLASPDAWTKCEQMARDGNIDAALAAMTGLAASEPNGRVRFQRKLLLADLCLQSDRRKLAASILQELNEIIELHKLETWETSEIVGGVWARLVRCYRDRAAGTVDRDLEAAFFLKLSRLDPWQAIACGEPSKENQP